MNPDSAYALLEKRFARLSVIDDTTGLLHWDMSTMMPEGGAESRAEQLATLRSIHHDLLTSPEMADLLARAEDETEGLGEWQAANLREMRRDWIHAAALPGTLVEAFSKACSTCEMVWRQARPAGDFKSVTPHLAEVLRLTREIAAIKAEHLGVSLYDALLDQYEPGGRAAAIEPVFADLEAFLPGFLGRVLDHQGAAPPSPKGPFPAAIQRELGLKLMAVLGFDFRHGRLDTSFHPFCGGTADDVRITTRYDEADFTSALMGVLHETGHALYDFGLPAAWKRQPVGRARGMSIHESQSLLIEMQACRSAEFMAFAAPLMRDAFGGSGPQWETENLYRGGIRVEPGFIRVDADEVTYPAHVILRFKLEKALVEGAMEIDDLPAAWNEAMTKMLGITPPDDRHGCLQDIHWYDGAWGYFPTYTLGAMTAAQLFDAAKQADPTIPSAIAQGDFGPLLGWLRPNIHNQGCLLGVDDLVKRATGQSLNADIFKRHLENRYLPSL